MDLMVDVIGLALMMVMVIEGLVYAAFPDHMKRMMAALLVMPSDRIRNMGLGVAAFGAIGVWAYLR